MKILIVEDEPDLLDSICAFLKNEDFLCDTAADYYTATEKIHLYDYICIILDINLPNGSGLTVLDQLKKLNKNNGVIIISAKNSLDDKVKGLKAGADDYLTKPFHLPELSARVWSIIRRKSFGGHDTIMLGNIALDMQVKSLIAGDRIIPLSRKEYELLVYFIGNKNKIVTKEAIMEHLWDGDSSLFNNYDFIYAHIKNLRKRIKEAGNINCIQMVYGLGYKFVLPARL